MEEETRGTVEPGQLLNGGVVNEALLEDLKLKFAYSSNGNGIGSRDGASSSVSMIEVQRRVTRGSAMDQKSLPSHTANDKHINIEDRLAPSDLPLPPNYYATVDRMRKSKEMREQRHAMEQSKELRSFLLPGNKPIVGQEPPHPPSLSLSVGTGKGGVEDSETREAAASVSD